ncbi:MAG: polysaccharide deacetylase family protein [Oscillospiraceae bacterium]|jgi:peptidoglycan/xylan/chitin deacetylase (PgdA/CDA1 family)/murein DD-endopeptidase MepM/ murein hydrolase activator NlpD|nr:polysaccharide deacetylase family protein [Oscillospiraceae bacterium]
MRKRIRLTALLLALCAVLPAAAAAGEEQTFIKWVDFNVPAPLMKKAIEIDTRSYESGAQPHLNWIELLAYLGAKNGGDFRKVKESALLKLAERLEAGETMTELTEKLKLYGYYLEAYTAVLGGMVGPYSVQAEQDGTPGWEKRYGLRAFHPIARGFDYQHYDDFGAGRNYGYRRKHLGHDMMALTGTPVIAVESGTVEELGWNRYGGWRIGIRSLDKKRYFYYAHLRQNRPYAEGLTKGQEVLSGDVIGYVGRTGYSSKENTNNITQSHLHLGIQLIFDETQKDGVNQIWIDPYEITKLLMNHRCATTRNPETKEHTRTVPYQEPPPGKPPSSAEALSEDPEEAAMQLPVIMYHSVLNNPDRRGKYTISPDDLDADLKWLKENGYHTVTVEELIAFAETGQKIASLKEGLDGAAAKPVLLTFDDGHFNNAHYAGPLLRQYGFTGVLFVVGEFIDRSEKEGVQNPNFSYVSRETIKTMAEEGVWEIESHSYSLHHNNEREGVKRARGGESDEHYYNILREDFSKIGDLIRETTGRAPRAFAYPLGAMSEEADKVLRESGIKLTVSCTLDVAEVRPYEPDSLYRLNRLLRSANKPVSRLLKAEV